MKKCQNCDGDVMQRTGLLVFNFCVSCPAVYTDAEFEKLKDIESDKIDILDKMLTSLVEVLEEKGVLTQEEWEKKIKEKIDEEIGLR